MMELGLRAEDPQAVALMRLTSCQGEMEAIRGLERKRSHRCVRPPQPADPADSVWMSDTKLSR